MAPSVTRSRSARSLPEPRCSKSARLKLAGRLCLTGGEEDDNDNDNDRNPVTSMFSYDPQTDRWRSESLLSLAALEYYPGRPNTTMSVLAHEG